MGPLPKLVDRDGGQLGYLAPTAVEIVAEKMKLAAPHLTDEQIDSSLRRSGR